MQVKKITVILGIAAMLVAMIGCSKSSQNDNQPPVEEIDEEQQEDTLEAPVGEVPEKSESEEESESANDSSESVDEEEEQEDSQDEERSELIEITDVEYVTAGAIQKKVLKKLGKDSVKTVYSEKYQMAVDEVLEKYKSKAEYTLEQPLLLMNPYGTMENGLYLYYQSEQCCNVQYQIFVENEAIPDYEAVLYSGVEQEMVTQHEGLIVGMMPGMKNYLTIRELDENGDVLRSKVFCINLESMEKEGQVIFSQERMEADDNLAEGMYCLMSDSASESNEITLVDNYGIRRLTITVDNAVNCELEIIDGYLMYPNNSNTFVVVDRLGKATHIYSLGDYQYEAGLRYNEMTGYVYMIATDTLRESTKDIILSLNLGNGELQVIYDCAGLISKEDGETYTLDSLDFFDDMKLMVNSPELSSVICIAKSEVGYAIQYIVSEKDIWKDTDYAECVYQAIGSFSPFSGQKQIQINTQDKRLIEGQYYITMLNESESGTSYYKIFVDENTKTFTMADRIDLEGIGQAESVQVWKDHIIYLYENTLDDETQEEATEQDFGAGVFGEYDEEGNLLREFYLKDSLVSYSKIEKISLIGIWNN